MNTFSNQLMAKMTVDEKIGQLNLPSVGFNVTGPILSQGVDEKIEKGLAGGVLIPLPRLQYGSFRTWLCKNQG